jgi:transposase
VLLDHSVMAIAIRSGEETRQVQMVCLDELVGADDVLRRIEGLVDWELVRETARPFYSDFGRPGIDPVVLVKVFLVAAIRGSDSMRETLRVARVDLSIRRFLGYGLTEVLPHHATFSYAQCVRFANSSVFEQLFTQVLASCREAGLLDGSRLIVDATHVEANAALKSSRAELEPIDGNGLKMPIYRSFPVPPVGIEPTTFGLKDAHLQGNCRSCGRLSAVR